MVKCLVHVLDNERTLRSCPSIDHGTIILPETTDTIVVIDHMIVWPLCSEGVTSISNVCSMVIIIMSLLCHDMCTIM